MSVEARDAALVRGILREIDDIEAFIEGQTEEDFARSRIAQKAVVMSLINIGYPRACLMIFSRRRGRFHGAKTCPPCAPRSKARFNKPPSATDGGFAYFCGLSAWRIFLR